jgi:hypothetical protein
MLAMTITRPMQGTIQCTLGVLEKPYQKQPIARVTPATMGAYRRASMPRLATLRLAG